MATLDSSIVNIALPSLTKNLVSDLSVSRWVVIIYLLVISCLLLPFGKISDLYGRRRLFVTGMSVFTFGSLFCALSPSLNWLVVSRVVQAIGASMLMANGPAIITAAFPSHELGKALGTMSMVVSIGLVSGPALGGFLISHFGWPSIFLINIPVGILGIILVLRFLNSDVTSLLAARKKGFDWAGAFLQTVIIIMLMFLFDPPSLTMSGGNPFTLSRLLAAALVIVFTGIFVKIEATTENPILDLGLMKNQMFWAGNLAGFFNFIAYSSAIVMLPFYLEEVLHLSTRQAGLYMTAIPVAIFIVAPISGRLSDRFGSLELSVAGALVGSLTLFTMSGAIGPGINENSHTALNVTLLSLIGLGMGLFQSPNNNAIMGSVPASKLGVASALLATVRNVGMVTGTGLSTDIFAVRMDATHDFVSSVHWACFFGGVVGAGALVASLIKGRGPISARAGIMKEKQAWFGNRKKES